MSLAILFHFLCAQHVSDINNSIIRSLLLFCSITTLVVLFLVRCVLEFRCGWVGVVSVLQAEASTCNTDTTPTQPQRNSNTHRTKNNTSNVEIQQNSRTLLMVDILMSETCWAHKKWNKIASDIKLVFYSSAFLNLRRTWRDIIKNVFRSSCKVPFILVRFSWNLDFAKQILEKYPNIRSSCGSPVVPHAWTDGRTDRQETICHLSLCFESA